MLKFCVWKKSAAAIDGVSSVVHADNEAYGHGIAENITNAVLAVQEASSKFSIRGNC